MAQSVGCSATCHVAKQTHKINRTNKLETVKKQFEQV